MPTVFWLRCLVDRELRNQQDAKCSGCSVNAHRQHRTTNYYPNNSCQTYYTKGPDKRVGWHCRTSKAIQFHRRDSLNVWLSLPVVNRCSVNQPFSKTFHRLTQHKIVFTEKTTSCECIRCNQPPIRILPYIRVFEWIYVIQWLTNRMKLLSNIIFRLEQTVW